MGRCHRLAIYTSNEGCKSVSSSRAIPIQSTRYRAERERLDSVRKNYKTLQAQGVWIQSSPALSTPVTPVTASRATS